MRFRSLDSSQTKKTLLLIAISAIACGLFQSDWIFWIPGAVFGLLFAIANFRRKLFIVFYTAISSGIYFGAVNIFFILSGNDLDNYIAGGFLAGAFGALALALITKLMSKISFAPLTEFRSTTIGGLTGILFVQLLLFGISGSLSGVVNENWVLGPFAFSIWQIPVAWSLTSSIQRNSHSSNGLPAKGSG